MWQSAFSILRHKEVVGLEDNEVMLTFDDGPNEAQDTTKNLLAVLEKHGVKACFCVIGDFVKRAPHLVRAVHEAGHLIVNHSQTHPFTPSQSVKRVRRQILACDKSVGEALGIDGYRSRVYRPPGGLVTPAVRKVMAQEKLVFAPVTFFKLDTLYEADDYGAVVTAVVQDALANKGGVYVLHEGRYAWWEQHAKFLVPKKGMNRGWVPQAVDEIITTLRGEGMSFVDPNRIEFGI